MSPLAPPSADLPPADRPARGLRRLFALAVLVLPVTGLAGVGALGELKGSASVYVLLAAMVVLALVLARAGAAGAVEVPRPVLVLVAALVAWLAVDAAVNYGTIATSGLGDRSGGSKFATSSMVLGFGLAVAILAGALLRDPRDLRALFLRPLTLAVLACAAFAVPELLTWVTPAAIASYQWTTGLFHTQENEQGRVVGRLMSIAFEAPDLSYFAALTLPWLLLGWRRARLDPPGGSSRCERRVAGLALAAGPVLVALSNSRTGFLMVAALVATEAAFWLGLRRLRVPALAFSAVLAVGLLSGMALLSSLLSHLGETAVAGDDVSTVTRSALLSAQLATFADHPLFGVGFGQSGFHVADRLPAWAWSSYEIQGYFETREELPPAFNVFGRIGAELGIPGLIVWFGFWIAAVHRVAAAAGRLPAGSFALHLNAALLASAVCLVVGGVSEDAFRRPETWILVAVTGLYAGSDLRAARVLPRPLA